LLLASLLAAGTYRGESRDEFLRLGSVKVAIFGGNLRSIHGAAPRGRRAKRCINSGRPDSLHSSRDPPHKAAGTSYEDRFRMVELACQSEPRFVVSALEAGKRKSYSILTIEEVRA